MSSLLLKNCFYIFQSADEKARRGEDILIRENRIAKIGADIDPAADRVLDCAMAVVVPGFVNTHHHFYQTLTRNLPAVQNAELFDWLIHLYEVWKYLDEEAVYYASMLAIGELLKTGCTTTTDQHYVYPRNVRADLTAVQFKAAANLGMRFCPGRGSMCLSKKDGGLPPDSVVQTEDEILADCERVIRQYHDDATPAMRKIILAPCSPFSVSKSLLSRTVQLARQYGVRLHTHLAETAAENQYCLEIHGCRPLQLMEDCGFIGADVSYAHGIHFNDRELKRLAETGTHIAHCATSNMRLGSGICRVKEMLALGINVGLAVDGSASNDSSDMLGEMRNALLLQRVHYGAAAISALDVMRMGTENGARLLGFEKVGKIREGWAADLAVYNVGKLEYSGSLADPLSAIIFSGYNHGTEYTIVNGKIVVEQGRLTGFDETDLMHKCNQISENLICR
jgi:8-oxoguanine deaminase